MELVTVNHIENQLISKEAVLVSSGNFIEVNTQKVYLHYLKTECLTPFYSDNMPSISHAEFINATSELVHTKFPNTEVFQLNIKISHTMQVRVAAAIGKSITEFTPEEKSIYYQRLAFMIELPTLTEKMNNNSLSQVVGGVRALNKENLFSNRGLERFQVFIGFKNFVCTNLCISTDGLIAEIRELVLLN
jgi:hypothetical protein